MLPKETDRRKEHITGILTSDSAIEKTKARPDLVQPGGYKRGRKHRIATTLDTDTAQFGS